MGARPLFDPNIQYVDQATPAAEVRYVHLPAGEGGTFEAPDFTVAAERTVNAVVHVTTEALVQTRDPSWTSSGVPRTADAAAAWCRQRVVITDDGYIVTNNHVVEGADKIQVHLNDRRMYEARVIGRDPSTDIALIKIDGDDLPTPRFRQQR